MPREHSVALSAGFGEPDCKCGPCSVLKIAAKSQGVEPIEPIGAFLVICGLILFVAGIVPYLEGAIEVSRHYLKVIDDR